MPKVVLQKMKSFLDKEEIFGGYKVAEMETREIDEFYDETAALINCKPRNIAFTYNATDSFSRALSSIPFSSGESILTTNDDYISNQIAFLSLQKKFGIKVLRAANLRNGDVDLNNFEEMIRNHHPKLVAVTHVPTNSGLIQQVEDVGALCQKFNVWFLLDACQSIGQLLIDISKIGCDFLSATGRKFLRGPRGTGFLYISDKALKAGLEPLFIDMRGADWIGIDQYATKKNAERFETWEFSYASLIGLKEAIRYANVIGVDFITDYNKKISHVLRENLSTIDRVNVLDWGSNLSSIVTFHVEGVEISQIKGFLDKENIFYSVSPKNAALIDFTRKGVEWAIRFSPHYFNTQSEVTELIDKVQTFVREVK
jgi:cysteine desulfurase / selenocysteine lyase